MKELTKSLVMAAFGLFAAAFITIDAIPGIVATGVFVFCYIYDPAFRRAF